MFQLLAEAGITLKVTDRMESMDEAIEGLLEHLDNRFVREPTEMNVIYDRYCKGDR